MRDKRCVLKFPFASNAMGIKPKDQAHLEAIVYGEDRLLEDKVVLSNLVTPIYTHLKEMYKPLRDQLREGKQKAK